VILQIRKIANAFHLWLFSIRTKADACAKFLLGEGYACTNRGLAVMGEEWKDLWDEIQDL